MSSVCATDWSMPTSILRAVQGDRPCPGSLHRHLVGGAGSRYPALPPPPQAPPIQLRRRLHPVDVKDRRHHVAHPRVLDVELGVAEEDALDERRVDRAVVAAPD